MKIKQMGLPSDHPEKEGSMVKMTDIVDEVKRTLARIEQGTANGVNGVTAQLDQATIS